MTSYEPRIEQIIWYDLTLDALASAKLAKAHILLRCTEADHKYMCPKLRDELVEKFNNIKEAQTVAPYDDAEDFCVAATAIIDPKNEARFKKALGAMRWDSGKAGVDAVEITLVQ